MTEQDYWYEIRVFEDRIWDLRQRIKDCENKLGELAEMKKKVYSTNELFFNAIESSKRKWDDLPGKFSFKGLVLSVKMIASPKDLLTGPEYTTVVDSFSEITKKIARKTEHYNDDINEMEEEIRRLKDRIASHKSIIKQLQALVEEGV